MILTADRIIVKHLRAEQQADLPEARLQDHQTGHVPELNLQDHPEDHAPEINLQDHTEDHVPGINLHENRFRIIQVSKEPERSKDSRNNVRKEEDVFLL